MKKIFTLFSISLILHFANAQAPLTFHDYSTMTIDGVPIDLSQYHGKKVMVVNVAAHCGYTPQFTQLQEIYDLYQSHGFEIIGFPSDDFNQQGTDSELINTCGSYNITFPLTESVHVKGGSIHPVFQWLTQLSLNTVSNASVSWNFHKFLIDEAGHWVNHYTQSTLPNAQVIVDWILSPSALGVSPSVSLDDLIEMKSSNPTSTSIDFTVKNSAMKNLNVQLFSTTGELIGSVHNGTAQSNQNINYDVSSLSSGIYFVKIQADGLQKTLRCSVVN